MTLVVLGRNVFKRLLFDLLSVPNNALEHSLRLMKWRRQIIAF